MTLEPAPTSFHQTLAATDTGTSCPAFVLPKLLQLFLGRRQTGARPETSSCLTLGFSETMEFIDGSLSFVLPNCLLAFPISEAFCVF